jgi:hypothetical protein
MTYCEFHVAKSGSWGIIDKDGDTNVIPFGVVVTKNALGTGVMFVQVFLGPIAFIIGRKK